MQVDEFKDPIEEIVEKCGGDWWGEHPEHRRADWQQEVMSGDTQRGYWDWCVAQIEEAEESLN